MREQTRAEGRSRAGRFRDSESWDLLLTEFLRDELESGIDDDLVSAVIEATRSRTLLDQMARRLREPSGADETELLALEKTALAFAPSADGDVLSREMRLASRVPAMPPFEDDTRIAAVAALEERYRATDTGFIGVETAATLEVIQQTLAPGELLIEFVLTQPGRPTQKLWAVCITTASLRRISLPVSPFEDPLVRGSFFIDGQSPIDGTDLGAHVTMTRVHIQRGDDVAAGRKLSGLYAGSHCAHRRRRMGARVLSAMDCRARGTTAWAALRCAARSGWDAAGRACRPGDGAERVGLGEAGIRAARAPAFHAGCRQSDVASLPGAVAGS